MPAAWSAQNAEVIVVGTATWQSDRTECRSDRAVVCDGAGLELVVDEVLKGTAGKRITVVDFLRMGFAPFRSAAQGKPRLTGVFFLQRDGDYFRPISYPSFEPLKERPRVKALLAMLADLKTFVDDPGVNDDADLAIYVGNAFATPTITCGDSWQIGQQASIWLRESDGPTSLWHTKTTWPVHLRYDVDANPQVSVIEPGTDSSVTAEIGRAAATASTDPYTNATRFTTLELRCLVDVGWPQSVGRLKSAAAIRYVRGRLRSSKPQVVMSALRALTDMHDGEAAVGATDLLRSRNADVVGTTAMFLSWTRDPRTAPAIIRALERRPAAGDDYHNAKTTDTLACAAEWVAGADIALPQLRRFARLGSSRAIRAVGRSGGASDVTLLLEAFTKDPIYTRTALETLVRRSNRPIEMWMPADQPQTGAQWQDWWDRTGAGFQVGAAMPLERSDECWYYPES